MYVAQQSFSNEYILRHCLWKLLSETGLLYHEQLTEMESVVLSRFVHKKYKSGAEMLSDNPNLALPLLNSAIDKILCEVKKLQLQSQKCDALSSENEALKSGLRNLIKDDSSKGAIISSPINRLIEDIGLSGRTVRILKTTGIDTLEKLRTCSLFRLRNHPGIGVKAIHEIQTALSKYSVDPSAD